jgi:hypothetical protein
MVDAPTVHQHHALLKQVYGQCQVRQIAPGYMEEQSKETAGEWCPFTMHCNP